MVKAKKKAPLHSVNRKKSDKANFRTLATVLLVFLLFTSLVSFSFLDQGISGIVRNNLIALVIFICIYVAWLKVTSDYEKMFKSSLGR
jgi:hypothetical protein